MKVKILTVNEAAMAPGFSHVAILTADDLTMTTVSTVQTITIHPLAAGDELLRFVRYLKTPFQNTAAPTFDLTTMSIGDDAGVATHVAAAELNINGTEIIWGIGNTAVLYTAASNLKVTFTPKTAFALNDINRGEVHIYYALARLKQLADSIAAVGIAKT